MAAPLAAQSLEISLWGILWGNHFDLNFSVSIHLVSLAGQKMGSLIIHVPRSSYFWLLCLLVVSAHHPYILFVTSIGPYVSLGSHNPYGAFPWGLIKALCEGPEVLRAFWFVQGHTFPVCWPSAASLLNLIYVYIHIYNTNWHFLVILKAFEAL